MSHFFGNGEKRILYINEIVAESGPVGLLPVVVHEPIKVSNRLTNRGTNCVLRILRIHCDSRETRTGANTEMTPSVLTQCILVGA